MANALIRAKNEKTMLNVWAKIERVWGKYFQWVPKQANALKKKSLTLW
jgi:hypothetical protein